MGTLILNNDGNVSIEKLYSDHHVLFLCATVISSFFFWRKAAAASPTATWMHQG